MAWGALLSPAAWDAFFSPMLHGALEGWIHSPFGTQVDDEINKASGLFLIGDGAIGTAAHPDGGAGGLLFGDGGADWNSTGGALWGDGGPGGTANPAVPDDEMGMVNQHGYGWMFWSFWNLVVHNIDQPPAGANVDTDLLNTLAQPYPQLVSGIPGPSSFEHGTFAFSYSTEMADGNGEFPAGAQTTIAVPAAEYPGGYQVSVTGGHVVSVAGAPQLVIASDSDAGSVSVVVSPAAGAAAR